MPAFGIYLPEVVLQGVTGLRSPQAMLYIVGGLALGMAVFGFISSYLKSIIETNLMNNKIRYLSAMFKKKMEADYQNIESAAGQLKFEKARGILFNDNTGVSAMLMTMGELLAAILGFFLYSGIISTLNPLIALLLIVTSGIHYFVLRFVALYEHRNRDQWAPLDRKFYYLAQKMADYSFGKDIRLFAMRSWLMKTLNNVMTARAKWAVKLAKRSYLTAVSDALIVIIRDGVAYVFLFFAILNHKISIADFVLYFGAIAGFSAFISRIIDGISKINRTSLDICAIRDFLDMPDRPTGGQVIPRADLQRKSLSIEFRDVSFGYDKGSPLVLKNLNFKIKDGEKIALVGVNGAGKTTLVKLLCGFYQPSSGLILINDISLSEFIRDHVYTFYAAVFQDLFVLPMTVAQNVALVHDSAIDRERVRYCLEQAGLSERLPDIDAPLTKMITANGIELSGGETQKLILARAIYKDAPMLILDEPTAALDPIAESELYAKYHELVKNKTSLFISHRLASTRFCDRVLFLDQGHIAESGTHEELLRQKGKYAEIFEIQSHYYAEGVDAIA
ncbi:MAG: ABC transporter ATP-binding protein/permease [Firmicutes bacterium]|nr:ABC transporter ATP-binding protein/permease [Bacillota bacterium]